VMREIVSQDGRHGGVERWGERLPSAAAASAELPAATANVVKTAPLTILRENHKERHQCRR
jgi:hypothetical protein